MQSELQRPDFGRRCLGGRLPRTEKKTNLGGRGIRGYGRLRREGDIEAHVRGGPAEEHGMIAGRDAGEIVVVEHRGHHAILGERPGRAHQLAHDAPLDAGDAVLAERRSGLAPRSGVADALQGHSADGAVARDRGDDLGVHRTCVAVARRRRGVVVRAGEHDGRHQRGKSDSEEDQPGDEERQRVRLYLGRTVVVLHNQRPSGPRGRHLLGARRVFTNFVHHAANAANELFPAVVWMQ